MTAFPRSITFSRSIIIVDAHEIPGIVARKEEFPIDALGALPPLEAAPAPGVPCGAGAGQGTGRGLDAIFASRRRRRRRALRLLAGA